MLLAQQTYPSHLPEKHQMFALEGLEYMPFHVLAWILKDVLCILVSFGDTTFSRFCILIPMFKAWLKALVSQPSENWNITTITYYL
jgi:hypothetical protein